MCSSASPTCPKHCCFLVEQRDDFLVQPLDGCQDVGRRVVRVPHHGTGSHIEEHDRVHTGVLELTDALDDGVPRTDEGPGSATLNPQIDCFLILRDHHRHLQRVLDLGRITADFFAVALEHLDQVPVLVERHGAVKVHDIAEHRRGTQRPALAVAADQDGNMRLLITARGKGRIVQAVVLALVSDRLGGRDSKRISSAASCSRSWRSFIGGNTQP